jgi:hypothetical protein
MKRKEDYTEEDERALRELASAIDSVRKTAGKAGEGAEARYAEAYKKCYRLGLKQYPLKTGLATR